MLRNQDRKSSDCCSKSSSSSILPVAKVQRCLKGKRRRTEDSVISVLKDVIDVKNHVWAESLAE